MKVEIWKDIENFSKYQVSNLGRIKSKGRYTKVGIKNQELRKENMRKVGKTGIGAKVRWS